MCIITILQLHNLGMLKVEKSDQAIKPFGGINFVIDDIKSKGIDRMIDNQLGSRSPQAQYSYSDTFTALWSVFYCGGDAIEDIQTHLNKQLIDIPKMKVMSADTILRVLKELKTEKVIYQNGAVTHEYNDNRNLNLLNIKIQKKLGLLKENCYYDFDFDHQFIPTDKYDSKTSYKKKDGYFPGNASINDMVVYIENRNGNSNVKYLQHETLTKAYDALKEEGIRINRSRADAGSYCKEVVDVVEKYSRLFYIRAQKCGTMREQIQAVTQWEEVEINDIKCEVSSVDYTPFGGKKTYRLVIQRSKTNQGQGNLFTEDARVYRSILTNDMDSSEKAIIEFYNARGTSEKIFDVMNNDFGWSKLPFSFMNENTVFLIVMAMCRAVYQWLIARYSKVFEELKPIYRLKKFIFRFITVCTKWVKGQGGMKLKVYDDRPYEKIATIPL